MNAGLQSEGADPCVRIAAQAAGRREPCRSGATAWAQCLGRWIVRVTATVAIAFGAFVFSAKAEGIVTTNSTVALLQAMLGGGTVRLAFGEVLTLETPLIVASDTLLEGALGGGRLVTLSGGGVRRLFRVLPGVRLEIRNCVLREGISTNGGAVYNEGYLVASNVVFSGNKATGGDGAEGRAGESRFGVGTDGGSGQAGEPGYGGAVYTLGEVVIVDSILSGNSAQGGQGGAGGDGGTGGFRNGVGGDGGAGALGYGGAVHVAMGGRLSVTNSLFVGNTARGGNGGSGGSETVVLGRGHGAPGATGAGGAIHSIGLLEIHRSCFATNSVTGGNAAAAGAPSFNIGLDGARGGHALGGAIASWSTGAVVNCTFVTNSVGGGAGGAGAAGQFTAGRGGNGGDGIGGGIHARGFLGISHATLAWNVTTNGAGGAGGSDFPGKAGSAGVSGGTAVAADGGRAEMRNSIGVATAGRSTVHGSVVDTGYNLFSDRGTGTRGIGSLHEADPLFTEFRVWTPLTTPGFLLVFGSPAIDAADPLSAVAVDQRGLPRPVGAGPDMGAMETGAASYLLGGQVVNGAGKQGVPGIVMEVGELAATTDADGRFRFGPLAAGYYTVAVAGGGAGFVPRLIQVPLFAETTNLVFRTVDVVIRFENSPANGRPGALGGIGVPGRYYRLEGTQDFGSWTDLERALADSQGRIRFLHNAAGSALPYYRLRAE